MAAEPSETVFLGKCVLSVHAEKNLSENQNSLDDVSLFRNSHFGANIAVGADSGEEEEKYQG